MDSNNLTLKLKTFDANTLIKWLAWIFASATGLIASVFAIYFFTFSGEISLKNEVWGTFGDFIGGTLNPILSFFGLIALLLTIVLQSRELEATREELRRSAIAHENTEKSLKEQEITLKKQQFETTFFSLLDQHNRSLQKIIEKKGNGSLATSEVEVLIEEILSKDSLIEAKVILNNSSNSNIGQYFRILFQILKFIIINTEKEDKCITTLCPALFDSPISSNEKMYSNIVRAFIPSDVFQLLAVNCNCVDEDGYWTYKKIIERYQFLEHMFFTVKGEESQLLNSMKTHYNGAFGSNKHIIK